MDFVKTHWISLSAGAVAVAAIVMGVMGMTSRAVVQDMERRVGEVAELTTLKSEPQNQETINAEKERGENFKNQYERTLKVAEEFNARKPVLEGAFPRPKSEDLPFRFKDEYAKAIRELPRRLLAGDLPSASDLEDAKEEIDEIRRLKSEIEGEKVRETQRGVGARPLPGRAGAPGATAVNKDDPNENPEFRARINKARSIRCYASTDGSRTSFHISPIIEATSPPSPAEMWYAQMGLWIQQDLVNAIAAVNEEAAQSAEDANVETMPVKRVVGVYLDGYHLQTGQSVVFPRIGSGARQGATRGTLSSFTGKHSADPFDVVYFTTELVVDQRGLLKLLDKIGRQNFYQLIGLSYDHLTEQESTTAGFLYGDGPVVRVTLEYEGYFARKNFAEAMPDEVRVALGMPKHQPAPGQPPGTP